MQGGCLGLLGRRERGMERRGEGMDGVGVESEECRKRRDGGVGGVLVHPL